MKRWFWWMGLAVAVPFATVFARTASRPSQQVPAGPAEALTLDLEAAAERLGGAIRFQTVSSRDPEAVDNTMFMGLHDHIAASFPRAQATLQTEVVGGSSLLKTWAGSDPDLAPIVLLAHLDVVPIEAATEDRWEHAPFSGEVAEGAVWGRGALDDKASAMGQLEAIEALIADGFRPKRTILLAFGADEEVGGFRGAKELSRVLDGRMDEAELVLDEGLSITQGVVNGLSGPVALVGVAEKGYLSLEILVESEGGHSSMPPPSTAAGRLATAVVAVERNPMAAAIDGATDAMLQTLGPEMTLPMRTVLANLWLFRPVVRSIMSKKNPTNATLRTTFAVTMLEGSPADNVLPARARAVVNARIHPRDDVERVIRHIKASINDPTVKVSPMDGARWEPSPVSPTDSPAFLAISGALRAVYPEAVVAPGLVIGFTDARHYQAIGPRIYRFAPLRFEPADLARLHGANERILLTDYERLIRFYAELLRKVAA